MDFCFAAEKKDASSQQAPAFGGSPFGAAAASASGHDSSAKALFSLRPPKARAVASEVVVDFARRGIFLRSNDPECLPDVALASSLPIGQAVWNHITVIFHKDFHAQCCFNGITYPKVVACTPCFLPFWCFVVGGAFFPRQLFR